MDFIKDNRTGKGWLFECPECFSDEFERPKRQEHLTFYEGSFLCSGCGAEYHYHSEDVWTEVQDWVHDPTYGEFGYNENGVCVYGAVSLVSYDADGVYFEGTIARTRNGWGYHHRYGSRFAHTGAGGGCSPLCIDADYPTEKDASIECVKELLSCCETEMSQQYNEKPRAAIAAFSRAKEYLTRQLEKLDAPIPGAQLSLF